ncbi:hypothetical protein NFI96_030488 [Prochilodus magdalenae]|nr:hypothetical protein NFI96_030488 [Prochilodus magdalenae]
MLESSFWQGLISVDRNDVSIPDVLCDSHDDMGESEVQKISMAIAAVFPDLPVAVLNSVIDTLKALGAEITDDLQYITEGDLLPVLKPIQARRLIVSWAQNNADQEFFSRDLELPSLKSRITDPCSANKMLFRVIISQQDIHKLKLDSVPDSVDGLKLILRSNLQLTDSFDLQYEDEDFHDFCHLTCIADLPKEKVTLRVLFSPCTDKFSDSRI